MALLDVLERDPHVEIVPLSGELRWQGWVLYREHVEKEWGLTDRLSFALMRSRGITEAATADDPFVQAGLRALLAET